MSKKDSKADLQRIDGQMLKVRNFFIEFFKKTHYLNLKDGSTDLSVSEIKALGAFREDRDYTMSELSQNAHVTMPSMTVMVDHLERKGMANRWRDSQDRRVVKARLTKRGKKSLVDFMMKRQKEMQHIFSQLTFKEREELIDSLEKAYTILKKIDGEASTSSTRSDN